MPTDSPRQPHQAPVEAPLVFDQPRQTRHQVVGTRLSRGIAQTTEHLNDAAVLDFPHRVHVIDHGQQRRIQDDTPITSCEASVVIRKYAAAAPIAA